MIGLDLSGTTDTKCLYVEKDALDKVVSVFEQCFGEQAAIIVADQTTFEVAGRAVNAKFSGRLAADPIIFPAQPTLYADFRNVLELEERLRAVQAIPVVVGSGTLNDLTKLAAHRLGRAYQVVATAASMDGYAAFGAAITLDGFKQTMSCPAPRAIVADLQILAEAPAQMTATGYGDLLGKITAGADWIIADALEVEPIEPTVWSMVQDSLRLWTGQPDLLRTGDPDAIAHLFEGLVMSGLAMQKIKNSRPASGTEHHFSHLWEMEALGYGKPEHPHGFKVGIGTIAATAFYERMLARDLTQLDIDKICRGWPTPEAIEQQVRKSHTLPGVQEKVVAENMAKHPTPENLRQRLSLLVERWPIIRERLAAQLMSPEQVQQLLQKAGCPTQPQEIGLTMEQLRQSYFKARQIRNRYTILELAFETQLLEQCVTELFSPGGFWVVNS